MKRLVLSASAALALVVQAAAQDPGVTIEVLKSQQHGQYLTDKDGRALYMFTADRQGQGEAEAVSNCQDACAEAWPPLVSEAEPAAQEPARPELLSRIERQDGTMQVTYNGWPLYYYVKDQGPGQATGQDVKGSGGEWYLLRPDGEKVGHE